MCDFISIENILLQYDNDVVGLSYFDMAKHVLRERPIRFAQVSNYVNYETTIVDIAKILAKKMRGVFPSDSILKEIAVEIEDFLCSIKELASIEIQNELASIRICLNCGTELEYTRNRKFCKKCSEERKREQIKIYNRAYYSLHPEKNEERKRKQREKRRIKRNEKKPTLEGLQKAVETIEVIYNRDSIDSNFDV